MINTFYVIRDGTWTAPEPAPAVPYSRSNLTAVTGTSVAGLGMTAIGRGWYQDGTDGSLKINSDVYADVNVAVYAFSKPSDDPFLGVLSSKLYARDLTTGNSVLVGSSGTIVSSVDIAGGIAGVTLIQGDTASASATPPVLVQVTTMDGQVQSVPVSLGGAVTQKHRVTWGLVAP